MNRFFLIALKNQMDSLRQKGSKIPLRVDLKLKNTSKIPLRVNQKTTLTKPKNVPRADPDLKRTSTIDRNKKTTIEVKRFNKPNLSSQILKARNKITTKEISQKLQSDQEKENQLISFEKKIPKISIQDEDPFKTSSEKEQIPNSNHPSQQNIEFVADENMKKFILSNRELTPSILKSCSNIKTFSVMERPSLYKKLNKVPIDPYKQAFADIANYDLASEGRRVSEMQKSRLHLSPVQNRNSLYKPLKCVGDPYQEAMKSIAKLRLQQKVKSCKKKVTFNLSDDDRSSNSEAKDANQEGKPISIILPKFDKISEKSSGCITLSSSEFEENMLLAPSNNPSKKVTFDSSSETDKVLENRQITRKTDLNQLEKKTDLNQLEKKTDLSHLEKKIDLNQPEKKTDFFVNKTSASASKIAANNEKVVHLLSPILNQKQKNENYTAIINHEFKNSILKKNINDFLNPVKTSEVRPNLFSNQTGHFLDKINPKIFTPQPISFYIQNKLSESYSPEFLSSKTTDILSCAPINTPLVLKSLSKRELSPVCKKLEFNDSPKESKKDGDSKENSQTFNLLNIMTQQKILDHLAHQECCIFLHEAKFPSESRENLQNPIARILNDGDEMHFVPVSLRKLS